MGSTKEVVERRSFAAQVMDGSNLPFQDPAEISVEIAMAILQSCDAEAVLAPHETKTADDILDQPFELRSFKLLRSGFEEGLGVYCLLEAAMVETGEILPVTVGGTNVVAQIARLADLDALPIRVRITRTDRPTSAGYYPLWLREA